MSRTLRADSKTTLVVVRLSKQEIAMLDSLAKWRKTTRSEIIRWALANEYFAHPMSQ